MPRINLSNKMGAIIVAMTGVAASALITSKKIQSLRNKLPQESSDER